MFPGVSFNEVNLDSWKLPSQGHFIVTLRWILLSMKRGNIRSLRSHKRPRLALSLCPAVFRYDLKGYADTQQCWLFLRHVGNNICTGASLTPAKRNPNWTMWYCWPTVTPMMSQFGQHEQKLTASNRWMITQFLIVLAKIWSNVSIICNLPTAMWRDLQH